MRVVQAAENIIAYANMRGYKITNLKLQKTLYYLQGYHAKDFSTPLFDESIKHWPYGPVVPTAYYEYCPFGASAIKRNTREPHWDEFNSDEAKSFVEVVERCLSMRASKLVELSHKESPWEETAADELISFESIQNYFESHDPLQLK